MERKRFYNTLIQTLRLVASSPDVQIAVLTRAVSIPDEIALTYNDAYLLLSQLDEENLISLKTLSMLQELDKLFENMSDNKHLWTVDMLKKDSTWYDSRKLALNILRELNEPYDKPDLSFIRWIK